MDKCFHGILKDRNCIYCSILREQALGRLPEPNRPKTILQRVMSLLRSQEGLTLTGARIWAAQDAALADGIITIDDIKDVAEAEHFGSEEP